MRRAIKSYQGSLLQKIIQKDHTGMQTPFDILNLPITASQTDIKKSYYSLILKHHPDKGGCKDQFLKITHAYKLLSDPIKTSMLKLDECIHDQVSINDLSWENEYLIYTCKCSGTIQISLDDLQNFQIFECNTCSCLVLVS